MFLARRTFIASLGALALSSAILSVPAMAQKKLDNLRASGAVGERYDGLLVDRAGGNGDLIAKVNAKRLAIYEKKAKSEGVSVDAVGQVYAEQIMKKAPKGTWFLNAQQKWVQK